MLERFERFVSRGTEITVRVSPDRLRTDFLQALKHFLRFWAVQTKIARCYDGIGSALRVQVGEARIQTYEVSVDIGKDGNPHRLSLVAL